MSDNINKRYQKCMENDYNTLDLSYCGLNSIPDNIPEDIINNITNLIISDNKIKIIDDIKQFHNITLLDASNCNIVIVKECPKYIKELDLSCNKNINIDYLSVLKSLRHLERLNLSNCNLNYIPENLPISMKCIDFDNNNISQISNLAYLTKLETFNIRNNKLKELNNLPNSIVEINASNNKITRIGNLIKNYIKLKKLDISNCEIDTLNSKLPLNLKMLFINGNNISKILDLGYLKKLKILDISNNNLFDIYNLPRSIIELDASYNNIKKLDDVLDNYPKLERLNVSDNSITNINRSKNIKILNCMNNKLKYIGYFDNIEKLNCTNNKITKLTVLPKLTELKCDKNRLREIISYPKLKFLSCTYNYITDIHICPKLKLLFCHNNMLDTVIYYPELYQLVCDFKVSKLSSKYTLKHVEQYKGDIYNILIDKNKSNA